MVAVGAKQAELAHAGLMNYLGERYDAKSGRTVEVYGRKLKMAASLDVYAPRRKGARGCEQTAEAVSEVLLDGLADRLTLDELSGVGRGVRYVRAAGHRALHGLLRGDGGRGERGADGFYFERCDAVGGQHGGT